MLTRSPWRKDVVKAELRGGSNSLNRPFAWYQWELTLECGHVEERPARWPKGASNGARGFARLHHPPGRDLILPAPKSVDCKDCFRAYKTSLFGR